MAHSDSLVGGKSFYQSEPLIARLRGIIRDYPEGVGIIKELIQNADDARATRVEITLDWRTHECNQLPDDRMVELLGPAMLVYNNQVFTDRDFDSIRSLGQSEKAQDLQKTGRFGVGFNAIYHVTDYPSFISRRSLIFFDPHAWAIPGASRQEPGREWSFAEAGWWEAYPDFMKVYEAGGLPFGVEDFQGTLFRLPLRTEAHANNSEIRKQAFSETNVRELLQELIQSGEELLLFLKSVQEIRVYEIPANSDGTRQEILTIVTKNKQEVGEARQKILNALPDNPDTLLNLCRNNPEALISVSYRHEIETISSEGTTNSTWRVVSVIRIDEGNELAQVIEAMHRNQEKVVPWASAAARITASNTDGNPKPVKGRVYCFLPLPLEPNLPVHINGFFNLNSSRDNLSSDSGQTGKDRPRAIWNQLLVRHVVSHAYANLLADLVQDIGRYNPQEFYKLFPINQITASKALEELHRFVIQLLYHKRVVHSAVEHSEVEIQNGTKVKSSTRWVTPPTVKVLPSKWENLVEPLRADNIDVPEPPLPTSILSAFKDAGCPLETFTPVNLRQHLAENKPLGIPLEDAPKASLRNRQWIVDMLRYCISDNHQDLRGLPLAILADKTLQVFGYNPIGTIYLSGTTQREIFANYPEWFLHPNLFSQVSLYHQIGVSNMDAAEVAKRLVNVIGSTQTGEYQWQPNALNLPNAEWLIKVYHYFANISQHHLPLEELKQVPLVPGDDGKLYKGGDVKTPLLCASDIAEETIAAVQYFGVSLVKAPAKLEEAIEQFAKRHPDKLILSLTGSTVIDIVYSRYAQGLPPYDQKIYTSLLNFLADPQQMSYDGDRLNKLRQLPIYPTNSNELVTLNDEDVYIPGDGYEPPEIAGTLRLLRLGKTNKEWLPLFQRLKVPVLNRARLIGDCLLREYASFSYEEQLTALAWIRDNLSKAKEELEGEPQSFTELQQEIKKARLVRCTDGRLRSAESIYSPKSDVVRNVLGNKAAIPDMEFYFQNSECWLKFFESLGMRKTPSADDLLACVDTLIQKGFQAGLDAIVDSILNVFDYIVNNWEELKSVRLTNSNSTLPEALKDKAWLPVERNPEKLRQYVGAIAPEPRLYRTKDICFVQDAHLVASQKPIFARTQRELLNVEIRNALGFYPVELNLVLDHFDAVIKILETKGETITSEVSIENLQSVTAIYEYLYNTFVDKGVSDEQRRQVKQRFEYRPCLWDESTGKFWKPKHAFQDNVPFFGMRRVTIPFSHRTGEVYQLLGQKRSARVEDYLDFLEELAAEYNNTPLREDDKNYALQVLNRLESQLTLEGRSAQNIPVLTANNQLRPAAEVLIPDAPWRKDYIERNRILHHQASAKLAKSAGSLSLLRDVLERPIEVNSATGTISNNYCQEWQRTLNSPEFISGVKRLIFHEYDSEPIIDMIWLTQAKVLPANQIKVDLFLKDGTRVASAIPGAYYFDDFKRVFHIICSGSRYIMLSYLAESVNNQLGRYAVQNLLPLASIIDAEPKNIMSLLNELRIRSLPGDNALTAETIPNSDNQEENVNMPSLAPRDTEKGDSTIYWGAYE
jgi:sacsin